MTLTVTLPLPPKELSPNARCHRMAKASAVKRYRGISKLAALSELRPGHRPMFKEGTARIYWWSKTAMHPDGDNALASLKAAFDGIADSGFLANDRELKHLPVSFFPGATKPGVVIHIEVP